MSSGKSHATKDRESNEEIQTKNRESNEKINESNLQFQRENLEYQKALNEQTMLREDSAAQRSVADMRASGLSPLVNFAPSQTSSFSAGSPMQNMAPYEEQGLYNRHQSAMDRLSQLQNVVSSVTDVAKSFQELQQLRLQNQAQTIENTYNKDTLYSRINEQYAREIINNYDRLDRISKARYDSYYGIHSGMSDAEKYAHIIARTLGVDVSRTFVYPYYTDKTNSMVNRYYESLEFKPLDVKSLMSSAQSYLNKSSSSKDKDIDIRKSEQVLLKILKGFFQ